MSCTRKAAGTRYFFDQAFTCRYDGPTFFDYGRIVFDLKDDEFNYVEYRIGIDRKVFNFNAKKQYEKLVRGSMDEVCAHFKIKESKATKTTYA